MCDLDGGDGFRVVFSSVQFSLSVMSDSLRPHRREPTRLLCPWDSSGKNTGMDCRFLQIKENLLDLTVDKTPNYDVSLLT